MSRAYAERMGLELEAERLVRMGESRAEVSRRLGVPVQTLAAWALRGGWRKKDLDLEHSKEITRETILAIRHGNAQVDAQNALRAQLRETMREMVQLMAEGSDAALEQVSRMIGAMEAPKRLEAVEVMVVDERAARRGSLGDNLVEGDPGWSDPDADEEDA